MTKSYQGNEEYSVYFFSTGRAITLKESEIEAINEEQISKNIELEKELEKGNEKFQNEIDELEDEISDLKDEISDLTKQIIEKENVEILHS